MFTNNSFCVVLARIVAGKVLGSVARATPPDRQAASCACVTVLKASVK